MYKNDAKMYVKRANNAEEVSQQCKRKVCQRNACARNDCTHVIVVGADTTSGTGVFVGAGAGAGAIEIANPFFFTNSSQRLINFTFLTEIYCRPWHLPPHIRLV